MTFNNAANYTFYGLPAYTVYRFFLMVTYISNGTDGSRTDRRSSVRNATSEDGPQNNA